MGFSMDEVLEALQIVKACKDTELHIDTGEIKLSIVRGNAGDRTGSPLDFSIAPRHCAQNDSKATPAGDAKETAATPVAAVVPKTEPAEEETAEEGLVPIKANVTSVFYRKPAPDEPPFVEIGDEVQEDTVVCLLEVMKCFRQVTAEVRGRVEKICAESNHLVEEGSVLFLIRPE